MTEDEWQNASLPNELLLHVYKTATERKRRLFALACCQRLVNSMSQKLRSWYVIAEQLVDGDLTTNQLQNDSLESEPRHAAVAVYAAVVPAIQKCPECGGVMKTRYLNGFIQACSNRSNCPGVRLSPWAVARHVVQEAADLADPSGIGIWGRVFESESTILCNYIRDIFGNPFRPSVIDPHWLT